jgi:hypothetical protein
LRVLFRYLSGRTEKKHNISIDRNFQKTHPVVFIYFLLNPSRHNTN